MSISTLLPLNTLGSIENGGVVTFGLWLPWVSAPDGNEVSVKIIHENDQYLQGVPPREFALAHSVRAPHGDFWSATVPIAGTPPAQPGSSWGQPGRYMYRYVIDNPNVGRLDWIVDPFAREFGVGKLSAFTLGYQPHTWSAAEANWRTPQIADLVLYEVNVAELGGDLQHARRLMAYLRDLGVNAIEVMPLSNVGVSVDWGYLPIGYFGVDERMGRRSDFQQLVDVAHQYGIAVIVDVVYGNCSMAPIDQRSEIWKFYKVQRIVVDTPDEGRARQQVAKRPAPRGSALNPWLDPALTSCEKVDESSAGNRGHKGE